MFKYIESNKDFTPLIHGVDYGREDPAVVVIPEGDINCGSKNTNETVLS